MRWLRDRQIKYTKTAKQWNWEAMMADIRSDIRSDSRFYLDTDEDGNRKPTGW